MKRIIFTILLIFTLTGIAAESLSSVTVEYFGDIGCSHCDLFEEKILPEAEEITGFSAEVEYINVLTESGYERCVQALSEMGYEYTITPVMIIGNNAYQGDSAVEQGLLDELAYAAEHGRYLPKQEIEIPASSGIDLSLLPVFLAGLVDGINPCAFATMLFFISWIALRGGTRKRIIISGSAFIAGVFTAYLSIGLGLFTLFQAAQDLTLLRQLIRYLFTATALVLAVLSARDAYRVKKSGRTEKITLQLSRGMKKKIHAVIRETDLRRGSFILWATLFATGIIVSLLELACTGQIYFPTIAYMVQSGGKISALLWLLLYNTAFILPLTILFTLALAGVRQKTLALWFSTHVAKGKLMSAGLFLMLALILWFTGV